jgi:hypothetical protein
MYIYIYIYIYIFYTGKELPVTWGASKALPIRVNIYAKWITVGLSKLQQQQGCSIKLYEI